MTPPNQMDHGRQQRLAGELSKIFLKRRRCQSQRRTARGDRPPDQDDNDETTDILYYDNNISVTRGDEETSEKYSEARQVRINDAEMTIEEVWTFGEALGKDYYTKIIGWHAT